MKIKCGGKCKWGFIAIGLVGIAYITDFAGIRTKIKGLLDRGEGGMPLPYGPSPDVTRDVRAGGVAPFAETLNHDIVSLYKPPFYEQGDIELQKAMMGYRPRQHQRVTLSGA